MKKIFRLAPIAAATLPFMALAQGGTPLETLLATVRRVVDIVIPILMALAVLVFLYGIVKYITASGDAEGQKEARGYIIYGLIGIFVLVAFWGIVAFIAGTVGVTVGGTTPVPTIPF